MNKIAAVLFIFCFFLPEQGWSSDWKRIYLATFPRSGNHWMRYLIEEATHIATSSVYPDGEPPHFKDPFPWGGYSTDHGYEGKCRYPDKGEVVIIKTHFPAISARRFDCQPSTKIIRIIRHPIDSLYSYYLFRYENEPPSTKIPQDILVEFIEGWRLFQNYWNEQPNVVTVRYEDLYINPYDTLKKVLKAIGYQVHPNDIARAINKHPPEGGMLRHISKYDKRSVKLIEHELGELMQQFNYPIPIRKR